MVEGQNILKYTDDSLISYYFTTTFNSGYLYKIIFKDGFSFDVSYAAGLLQLSTPSMDVSGSSYPSPRWSATFNSSNKTSFAISIKRFINNKSYDLVKATGTQSGDTFNISMGKLNAGNNLYTDNYVYKVIATNKTSSLSYIKNNVTKESIETTFNGSLFNAYAKVNSVIVDKLRMDKFTYYTKVTGNMLVDFI